MTEALPNCRSCGTALTITLVDLGYSPLANSYVSRARAHTPDPRDPLHGGVCSEG